MRKILASVLTIVALVGSVGGVAFAIFSDTASIPGNTISTGAIDIGLSGSGAEQTPQPIVATGLMPGDWSDWKKYLITNNSNENIKLYFYVTDVSGDACVKTNLEIATGPQNGNEFQFLVYNSGINNIKGIDNKVEITGSERVFDPVMMPDDVADVHMRAGLDLSANNNQSNEACTWTGVFYAEGSTQGPVSIPVSSPEENED